MLDYRGPEYPSTLSFKAVRIELSDKRQSGKATLGSLAQGLSHVWRTLLLPHLWSPDAEGADIGLYKINEG